MGLLYCVFVWARMCLFGALSWAEFIRFCLTSISRYQEAFKCLTAFLKLIIALWLKGQGAQKSSNSSLESLVLSWGAHSERWLSAHTSAVSTRHELLARAPLHFVQSLGSMPALVPKRWHSCQSDSFIPAFPQPPRWNDSHPVLCLD